MGCQSQDNERNGPDIFSTSEVLPKRINVNAKERQVHQPNSNNQCDDWKDPLHDLLQNEMLYRLSLSDLNLELLDVMRAPDVFDSVLSEIYDFYASRNGKYECLVRKFRIELDIGQFEVHLDVVHVYYIQSNDDVAIGPELHRAKQ